MNPSDYLLNIIVLLAAALLLGGLAERLRQNAVVGYLLAGMLLGPAGLDRLRALEQVRTLAELGVALLLFTIGLEFSWRRLRELGRVAALGGSVQIVGTAAAAMALARAAGWGAVESFVFGAAVSMSSTAVVLRVLLQRAELDSVHGRAVVGIALFQDLAVIPLMLLLSVLAGRQAGWDAAVHAARDIGKVALVAVALFLLTRYAFPRLFQMASAYGNRDLPALLAASYCLGGVWASHALGLSPVLGSFLAGMLLAESPFAAQIRADIVPLRAGFVTLFFASIGTLVRRPESAGLGAILGLTLAIVVGKSLIAALSVAAFRVPVRPAVMAGVALAQIGEFSFVLAEFGRRTGLLGEERFQLLLAASVVTLLVTPSAIAISPGLAGLLAGLARRPAPIRHPETTEPEPGRVLVVGYGPAGQETVGQLEAAGVPFRVIDLNPRTCEAHRTLIPIQFGDATRPEVLEQAGLPQAAALVVTVPDPQTAGLIINQARRLAPRVPIVSRARYHIHAPSLRELGAQRLVDEERLVGERLGADVVALVASAKAGTS
ncbi:MAG: cation:proton antiporter [Bryobacterales bacterium]|nr:cation:proton antiporter [Bryobacterales bacterium]